MKKHMLGYFLAFITITIWSSTFVVTKLILDYLTPVQVLVSRSLIAVVFLFILYPKIKRDFKWKSEILFMLSGFALALYFIFENNSLKLTYPSNVGLLVATSPLFTAIIVSFVEKKSLLIPKNIFGFLLAFIGISLVVFGKSGIEGFQPLGDFLAIAAALMFSVYTVILNTVKDKFHIIQKTRKVFIYTFLLIIIYSLSFNQSIIWDDINIKIVLGILFLAIIASSFAFLLWNKSISILGTFKTNLFIYLVPVVTMIISYIVLNDEITLTKSIGAIIIIIGLYISERE